MQPDNSPWFFFMTSKLVNIVGPCKGPVGHYHTDSESQKNVRILIKPVVFLQQFARLFSIIISCKDVISLLENYSHQSRERERGHSPLNCLEGRRKVRIDSSLKLNRIKMISLQGKPDQDLNQRKQANII